MSDIDNIKQQFDEKLEFFDNFLKNLENVDDPCYWISLMKARFQLFSLIRRNMNNECYPLDKMQSEFKSFEEIVECSKKICEKEFGISIDEIQLK